MNRKYWLVIGLVIVSIFLVGWVRMRNQAPQIPAPQASPTPPISIIEYIPLVGSWKWTKTQMNDGELKTPSKSDSFLATFEGDGKFHSTTDCNSLSGSYKLLENNG